MKVCPVCNSSMDDSTLFCTACGSRLPDAAPAIQPEVAPPVYAIPTPAPAPVQEPVAPVQEPVAPVQEPAAPVQEPAPNYVAPDMNPAPNYAVPGAVPPGVPGQQPFVTTVDPADHTAEFTPEDVSDHKVYALLVYLGGIIGIIPALLIGKDSPYLKFHIQQKMKLMVTSLLVTLVGSVTGFLILPAIAAAVISVIIFVVNLICFFKTASGKSVEAPIVKDIKLFK